MCFLCAPPRSGKMSKWLLRTIQRQQAGYRDTHIKCLSGNTHFHGCFSLVARVRQEAGLEFGFVLERKFKHGVTAFEVEFLADIRPMVFNRAMADKQFRRNLFAGFVLSNQFQDAPFGHG